MYREKARYGQDPTVVVRSAPSTFNAATAKHGRGDHKGEWKWPDGGRVFVCSWSDFFIEDADEWRADAWAQMRQRPGLTFQLLTKRPERIKACLPYDWGYGWPNVWIGASVENQKAAEVRIPLLAQVPARVRFLSCEPLLSAVNLGLIGTAPATWGRGYNLVAAYLDWVIIGGESGSDRPTRVEWIRALVDECRDAGVACFVKQMGENLTAPYPLATNASEFPMPDAGGPSWARIDPDSDSRWRVKFRDSHGGEPAEWAPDLRVRQFPVAP
jgi:protein gp37